MAKNIGHISISEAYDYRVAVPLVVVAVLGLLFVDINSHKPVALKSASSTGTTTSTSKRLVSHVSAPSVQTESNVTTLSPAVNTEDLSPGETPLDIQTASPQSSSSSAGASTSSGASLQDSGAASMPDKSSQPSQSDIENIINGTSNDLINVPSDLHKTVDSTLNLL